MKTRQIHQPRKQRYRYIPDPCRPFEAHIGRCLCKWERAIIHAFETNRLRNRRAGRFIIVDNDPAIDSSQLLIVYFLWRAHFDDIMFVAPTRAQINRRLTNAIKEHLPRRVIAEQTGSARRPWGMRGKTWRHCLMLNTERYPDYEEVIDTVVPPLPIDGDSIMVIHTRKMLKCPPAFTPTGPPVEVGIINQTDEPQIIIIELVENPPENPTTTETSAPPPPSETRRK